MFEGFFRSLVVTLCGWIYPLIPKLYSVFYSLASAKFFDESVLRTLANNIYILVSVVMLFVLAIQLIKTIVNPDLFDDKNKGLASIFKRMVIALILIVLIPIGFNQVYHYQNEILNNNLIEKVIVGYSGSNSMGESNAGQVLAASTIVDLLEPNDGAQVEEGSTVIDEYKLMISTDISYIKSVGKHINDKYSPTGDDDASDDEKEYVFKFEPLIALAAGCAVVYFLFIFSMDMAVRMLKLSLFELTAPVTVIAYIYGGDEQLKRWWKEVSAIYVEVFVKVAIIAFIIFAMNNLDTFGSTLTGDYLWLIKLLVLIGLFTLAGQLPDLIKSLFGVTYTPKGGIGGRLGKMAGPVGKLAQDSWNKVKKGAATVAGAGALGLAAVANPVGALAAGGIAAGYGTIRHGWNNGFGGHAAWKNTKVGKGLTTFGKATGAFLGSGNPIKGTAEAGKVISESDRSKQRQYERELQQEKNRKINAGRMAEAAATAGGTAIPFKTDSNGIRVIDADHLTAVNSQPADFAKMVNASNLSTPQKDALTDYNEKQNKLMKAQKDSNNAKQIAGILKNAMDAESDANAKSDILSVLNKFQSGDYADVTALSTALYGATSTALTTDIQAQITNLANEINSGNLSNSIVKLEANVTNAQASFDIADSKLTETIDKASTEQAKQNLKTMKSSSKALNKKNTNTI